MKMKAITIWQPWADHIVHGLKKYETRHWATNQRGPIAIHAGKQWTADEKAIHTALWNRYPQIQAKLDKHVLPLGAVLGIFNLVDCIPTEEIRPHLSPLELALGDYSDGRYAWRLQPVRIFADPIFTSGKQGLWTWEYEMPKKPVNKPRAYLDTETTGLDNKARILEISIVDEYENILLDTFINPQIPIPEDATRVHHITNDMVKDAPPIEHFREQILAIFEKYDVYIYNAEYDIRLLKQSATGFESITGKCVMKPFSELIGDWSSYHNNYKFQSLDKACRHYGVTNPSPHRALGDAISACRVHKAMLAKGAQS